MGTPTDAVRMLRAILSNPSLAQMQDALPLFDDRLLRADLRAPAARAVEILNQWDGSFQRDEVGAAVFQRWQDHLLEALFADELQDSFAVFRNTAMAEKSLFSLYWKPASPWWDNRQHPIMDGRQAAIEQAWIRTVETLPDDPAIHRAILAYISDYGLITTLLMPHGIKITDTRLRMASLDHAMWFHRPFRMDEWLLYVCNGVSSAHSRGLAQGRFYRRNGELVVSVVQEALVRLVES